MEWGKPRHTAPTSSDSKSSPLVFKWGGLERSGSAREANYTNDHNIIGLCSCDLGVFATRVVAGPLGRR